MGIQLRPREDENHQVLFFRNIPKDLKKKWKRFCYGQGMTMHDMLVKHMKEDVHAEKERSDEDDE